MSARYGEDAKTIAAWLDEKRKSAEFIQPPGATKDNERGSIRDFDVWQFASADKDSGQQSYFGALPPQVKDENPK